jgi:P4 family phage/plasmid primase-like protien
MIQLYKKGRGMERLSLEYNSLDDVLSNLDRVLAEIKDAGIEPVNIFYTLNDSGAGDREFQRFTHLAFDIDGNVDLNRWAEYHQVVKEFTGAEDENISVICSGHGLHFIMPLVEERQFDDPGLFPKKKLQYRAICQKLEHQLNKLGLEGKLDSGIFDRARIMRLPGTKNVKPNKPEADAALLHLGLTPFDFSLEAASGIEVHSSRPNDGRDDSGDKGPGSSTKKGKGSDRGKSDSITWFGANDDAAILSGCNLIRKASEEPEKLDEPLWYAVDSVVGRLKNGRELIHKWAAKHQSYEAKAVDSKIDQALEKSGPRTCESVEGLWDGCKQCKFYKKVASPIQIKGPDFISTESTGFHTVSMKNGAVIRKPCYEDLQRFYRKQHTYKSIADSRKTRVWAGTFYEDVADTVLENFAQTHFDPWAETRMTKEFSNLIQRTEIVQPNWFKETTEGKLNLKNGVLNLKTRVLSPHDPKFGFLSQLDYDYDPEAKSPLFDKFLHEISCGDKELEVAIMQFMAYAISGERCSNEKVLVLHGEGANGKSTLIRVMKSIFGKSMSFFQPEELASQFDRSRLERAHACVIEEMPSWKDKAFWEKIKGLASGNNITVSEKFKPSYEIENRTKFIITCNELPGGTDPSHGYFRRLLIVPFNARFDGTQRDPRIADRIIDNELSGVLNRLLESYTELTKNDFMIPEPGASTAALADYKVERDNVWAWWLEHFRVCSFDELPIEPDTRKDPSWLMIDKNHGGQPMIANDEAYRLYKEWCESHGFTAQQISNSVHWGRRLRDLLKREPNIKFVQRTVGDKRPKVIVGVMPMNREPVLKKRAPELP